MSGNKMWSKREEDFIRKHKKWSIDDLRNGLEFLGYVRTWMAIYMRKALLEGRRQREN